MSINVKIYPYKQLGQADYGWLKARYHFSFAHYFNKDRTHFGTLRVINDDIVAAGKGFEPHSHDNMEIITYVRQGAISHKDSLGNEGRTEAGDVQVMSAGSGITHAEYNRETEDTKLYQIWIETKDPDVKPRWDAKKFPKDLLEKGQLPLLVSGKTADQSKGALFIHQNAFIYGGRLKKGAVIDHPIQNQAYVLASTGSFVIEDGLLQEGDGAEITGAKSMRIKALTDAELLVIDVPV